MIYFVKSGTMENCDGMSEPGFCRKIEAMSEVDAVIKASKIADSDDEVIKCEGEWFIVVAYRLEDGSYEFHIYCNGEDSPFTI